MYDFMSSLADLHTFDPKFPGPRGVRLRQRDLPTENQKTKGPKADLSLGVVIWLSTKNGLW